MKKLLEKMILFFVETKCFKLVTKRLFYAYFGKNPLVKCFYRAKKIMSVLMKLTPIQCTSLLIRM